MPHSRLSLINGLRMKSLLQLRHLLCRLLLLRLGTRLAHHGDATTVSASVNHQAEATVESARTQNALVEQSISIW
jgi:hypothetical protein